MQPKSYLKQPAQSRVKNKKKPVPLFAFGERIWVTGGINRVDPISKLGKFEHELTPEELKQPNRVWEREEFIDGPRQAIFLGFRRLNDGTSEYEDGEDGAGYYFTTSASHKGALICIEGREPERVFLDQCKKFIDSLTLITWDIGEVVPKDQIVTPVMTIKDDISVNKDSPADATGTMGKNIKDESST